MRIIFLGSGDFGVPTLKRIHDRYEVVAVVTQPDRPAGRMRQPTATPIAQCANALGLSVRKCADVNDEAFIRQFRVLQADIALVIAFGQKLAPSLLDALGRYAVNLHGSLLPKYRGAAPINWAIIKGEAKTGLSVISVAKRMDGGLIHAQSYTRIDPLETARQLHDRLATMGPDLVERVLEQFQAGSLTSLVQDETLVTRAPKLSKADGAVDFQASAVEVRCRVHGLTPWPGVSVTWVRASGTRLKLAIRRVADEMDVVHQDAPGTILRGHRVAVGIGAIRLLEVQIPGKRTMSVEAFVQGHPICPGDRLVSGSSH